MFVLRLKRPEEDFNFRAFGSRKAAVERFRTAQSLLIDGEIEDCALLEVRGSDPERAVELASQGDATLIEANLEDPRAA
ncbi:hypothetical protein [Bradyrhizobium sp.]|uniref:hypothetical protein n=1 Tax=Bradyrhizobium sp. TaxID=376 RepID=UPI003C605579